MMRTSIAGALLGAAALILGAAQVRADVIAPCEAAAAPLSDCIWLGDETGAVLAGSFAALPEQEAGPAILTSPFPVVPVLPIPGPIALLESSSVPGGNPQVSDLIVFDYNNNSLVATLISDTDNAHPLQPPASALTFLETGKPQDVFKFDSPAFPAGVHVWVQSDVEPIPEPAIVSVMLAGFAALGAFGWIRKRA